MRATRISSHASYTPAKSKSSHLPGSRAPKGKSSSNPSVSSAILVSGKVSNLLSKPYLQSIECSTFQWWTLYFFDSLPDLFFVHPKDVLPGSLTASLPLKIGRAPKGKFHLPTIIFQGWAVKLQGCTCFGACQNPVSQWVARTYRFSWREPYSPSRTPRWTSV